MMMKPTPIEARTISGGTMLGKMWRSEDAPRPACRRRSPRRRYISLRCTMHERAREPGDARPPDHGEGHDDGEHAGARAPPSTRMAKTTSGKARMMSTRRLDRRCRPSRRDSRPACPSAMPTARVMASTETDTVSEVRAPNRAGSGCRGRACRCRPNARTDGGAQAPSRSVSSNG